jgi:hypothetical protein
MSKEFKVGDRVKVVGHPFIKEGILATVIILKNYYCEIRFDGYEFNEKFGNIDCLIGVGKKYLEKVEDCWLHFKTTNRYSEPLFTREVKLQKEIIMYNCMYQWKREFDPEEVNWENNKEDKWYIYRYPNGDWDTSYTFGFKQNLQVYFTTKEKAEQCLKWLKKQGVLY